MGYVIWFYFLLMERLFEEMIVLFKKNKDNFCCEYEFFLNIEIDYVMLDELYLLFRVVDVLLNNFLEEVF